MHLTTLHPNPPYNFPQLLMVMQHYPYPAAEIVQDDAYYRVLSAGDGLALICVRSVGSVEAPALEVELLAQEGEIDQDALIETLNRVIAVDADRASFFDFARHDPALWRTIEPLYGIPMICTPTVFDALVQAIIEQHIAWKAARRATQWLMHWADRCIVYEGQTFYTPPTPAQIAAAQPNELKPLKITNKRIALLIDFAQQIESGALDLDGIAALPPAEATAALIKLHGIGRWTAAVILSRAVGLFDEITDTDVALQAAVNWYLQGENGRMSPADLREALSAYGEYAGLAGSYILHRWVLDRY